MGSEKIKMELLHSEIRGRQSKKEKEKELFKARKVESMQGRTIYWGTEHDRSFKNKSKRSGEGEREGRERGATSGRNWPNETMPTPREIAKGFQPAGPSVSSDSRANLIRVRRLPTVQPLPPGTSDPHLAS